MFLILYDVSTLANWLIRYLKCLKVVPQVPQSGASSASVPQSGASSASKWCLKCLKVVPQVPQCLNASQGYLETTLLRIEALRHLRHYFEALEAPL